MFRSRLRDQNKRLQQTVAAQQQAIESYKEACVIHDQTNQLYVAICDKVRNHLTGIIPDKAKTYSLPDLAEMVEIYVVALEERLKHE